MRKILSHRRQPQHDRIDNKLNEITDLAERRAGGRRLYFYFSGHGLAKTDDPDSVLLCLCDFSRDKNRNSALNSEIYLNYIKRCAPFSEVVVLLDCCRDRSVEVPGQTPKRHPCATAHATAGSTRTFVAYATSFEQSAFEAETEDDAGGKVVHGHFTQALLAALRGDAASAPSGVPAKRLESYLEDQVPRLANQRQQATVHNLLRGDPDAVFGSAAPREPKLRIEFTAARSGEIELIGPRGTVMLVHDVADGPWNLRLDNGLHMLRERRTGLTTPLGLEPTDRVEF